MVECLAKLLVFSAAAWALATPVLASAPEEPFLGSASCASSGCHGGAGPKHNQNLVWAKSDFHSRAYAILATSRSTRIAEALNIESATGNERCTVCHLPAAGKLRFSRTARADEGVSCESCHGAAEPWLRSHTRPDYTHLDRVKSGMRELKGQYARANVCVGCHEKIEPAILEAGHPKLVFELDSQVVSQPPHWKDADPWQGPRAWLTGQAVALREQSQGKNCSAPRAKALGWLLEQVCKNMPGLPKPAAGGTHQWAEELARAGEQTQWSESECFRLLKALAAAETASPVDLPEKIDRAEALAQGLDRLTVALGINGRTIPGADQALGLIFNDLRDPSVFDPIQFAQHLSAFKALLNQKSNHPNS